MKRFRFLIAGLALVAALGVLGISLASSVPSVYSAGEKFRSNDRQFYLSGDVLPDHVMYPAVMAADRVKLEAASPTEKAYLMTTYANLRLEYARKLLEKGNCKLALTTLTKSQKYLIRVATESQELDLDPKIKRHVLKTIQFHLAEHQKLKEHFNESEKMVVEQLDAEIRVFVDGLKTDLDL